MRPLLAALLLTASLAAGLPAGALAADDVSVRVAEAGVGAYTVAGGFRVAADAAAVWDVLTDYGGLSGYIPAIRSGVIRRAGPHVAFVAQDTTTTFLAVKHVSHVLLRVEEEPPRCIRFTDVAGKDFDGFTGAWRLEAAGDAIAVAYEAHAKPRFMPPVIGPAILEASVTGLLRDLKREVLRRHARR